MSKRPELRPIYRLLARVQSRERLADALTLVVRIGLPSGLVLAAIAVVASRLLLTPLELIWLALAPTPLALLWALLRPRSLRAAARRVDAHYRLDDRLGNAIEFAERPDAIAKDDPRTQAMAELVIADGARVVEGLRAKPVVPLRAPAPRLLDFLALMLVGAAMLLPQREPEVEPGEAAADGEGGELGGEPVKRGVDMTRAEPLRDELVKLKNSPEEQIARIANEMLDVLADLESGELDRAAALQQLEMLDLELRDIEQAIAEEFEEDPWMMSEAMRELGEDLRDEESMREVSEALAETDAEQVEKEMEEAFENASQSEEAQKALDEALEQFERSLAQTASEQTGTEKAVEQAERELQRQKDNPAEDPEEQERELQRKQERLEELKRQAEAEKQAREKMNELQKLARESKSSSGAQNQSGEQKRKDAQQKLSEGTGKATKSSRKMKQANDVRDAMDQAKSFVQRSGQNSDAENRRKQQQERFAKAAKGQKGKNGKPATMLVEGQVGEGPEGMGMEGEGEGEGQGEGEGEGNQPGQGNQPSNGQGPGIGEGSVDGQGEETAKDVDKTNERVNAEQGKGRTRAEVIETASQEGFANESYKRVFQDYESFAQSAMDSDELPAGQRRRVKRYFQMIQPQ
jgi:hypothetical protein